MPDENITLRQASDIAHVTTNALLQAIKRGRLEGKKENDIWYINKQSLEQYRLTKYNRLVTRKGASVYSPEKGYYSVFEVAKVFSDHLNVPYNHTKFYHLIRKGEVKATKRGGMWVIQKDEAVRFLQEEEARLFPFQIRVK
jgi:hypothetical protein